MPALMQQLSENTVKATRDASVRTAFLGWSPEAFDAMRSAGKPFMGVVPPEFGPWMEEHKIPWVPWHFGRLNDRSTELGETLHDLGVQVAVPLYEETVEWAGALNARFQDDPRLFNRAWLFRDKAMMKRKAQLHGLRVGVFEEVETKEDVRRFLARVNEALLKLDEEPREPVHLKPFRAAGTIGHRMIRTEADIDEIPESQFPLLAESHLAGQEFSCEAWVHDGRVRFLNITEYVKLGYSNFIPAGPELEAKRPAVEEAMQELVDAFGFRNGFLHPEWFVSQEDEIKFGEVAARVPGGHILELVQRAYGFNPFLALALAWDPDTPDEELDALFPEPVAGASGHAGCLMVYPKKQRIEHLAVPEEVTAHPYYERHTLVEPLSQKVPDREGFGGHFGTVFYAGDDPDRMRSALQAHQELDFYR